MADTQSKRNHSPAACATETTDTKLDKRRRQRNIFQTEEQDKTTEEQLNESGNVLEKLLSNDRKDNPRFQKKNGGTDWEDTRTI